MKPDPSWRFLAKIPGHCYSLKNHRPIHRAGGRPFLGKSPALRAYQEKAALILRAAWAGRAPLQGEVKIRMSVHYAGPRPDALGPAETIFDCLQAAGVVQDDVQLVPVEITRVHCSRDQESVTVVLECPTERRSR